MLIKHLVELTNSRVCQIIMICRWFITKSQTPAHMKEKRNCQYSLFYEFVHISIIPMSRLPRSIRHCDCEWAGNSEHRRRQTFSVKILWWRCPINWCGSQAAAETYLHKREMTSLEWMNVCDASEDSKKQFLLLYFYFESDFKTKGIRNGKTFTKIGWKLLNGCQHRPCLTRKYGSTRVYWR